jgi:hypothetical protein
VATVAPTQSDLCPSTLTGRFVSVFPHGAVIIAEKSSRSRQDDHPKRRDPRAIRRSARVVSAVLRNHVDLQGAPADPDQ